jgi:hypothetical protein
MEPLQSDSPTSCHRSPSTGGRPTRHSLLFSAGGVARHCEFTWCLTARHRHHYPELCRLSPASGPRADTGVVLRITLRQQCGHRRRPDHPGEQKPPSGVRQSPISERIGIRAELATAMPITGSRSSSPSTSPPARRPLIRALPRPRRTGREPPRRPARRVLLSPRRKAPAADWPTLMLCQGCEHAPRHPPRGRKGRAPTARQDLRGASASPRRFGSQAP